MPTIQTSKINDAGKWLRTDAAASYARMLQAGMPLGGIAAAGRTMAQQEYLYNLWRAGKGNLAAYPNARAPHIRAIALDITRGTAAHTWATVGGVRLQTKTGESIRANWFGWYRTVPSEAWHFAYFPERDQSLVLKDGSRGLYVKYIQEQLRLTPYGADLRADGDYGPRTGKAVTALQRASKIKADGKLGDQGRKALEAAVEAAKSIPAPPVAPVPAPTPTPTPPVTPPEPPAPVPNNTTFRFGEANLEAERFGGDDDDSASRGEFLSGKMACSVYALTEVTQDARNAIRKVLTNFKTYPVGYVAVMWDSTKWSHVSKKSISFGTDIHGAIRAELVAKNGRPLDVIAVHVRPNVAIPGNTLARAAGKQGDIKKALSLCRKGVPTIIAGDFNTSRIEKLEAAGFVMAHRIKDTHDKAGVQALDFVFVSPELVVNEATQIDAGTVSDHLGWRIKATLPASTS